MKRLWDMVPMPDFDAEAWRQNFTVEIERVRNSFWYLHHAHRSSVRVVESDPEDLAPGVGDFDVGVVASVLLHCRSPISVLEGCPRRVRKTMIVAELYDATLGELPVCHLLPRPQERQVHTWWALTPAFVVNTLGLMGYGNARINVHHQPARERWARGSDVHGGCQPMSAASAPGPRISIYDMINAKHDSLYAGSF